MKLQTPLCGLLGIQYPIFNVGFARAAVPELAAAVSNAGGCGVIGATNFPAPYVQERIQTVRNLTGKPFGANVILANKMRDETIDACLAVRIPLLVLFWGDPAPYVREAHHRGTRSSPGWIGGGSGGRGGRERGWGHRPGDGGGRPR